MKGFIRTFFALFLACALIAPQAAFAADDATPLEAFPDEAFRSYVAENADADGDGALSAAEKAAVTEISVSDLGIKDLAGIESFPSLVTLECGDNALESLDISKNPALAEVNAKDNPLRSLTLGKSAKLHSLNVRGTTLAELDLSEAPNLIYLACGSPALTSLDLRPASRLAVLDARGATALTSITAGKTSLISAHGTSKNVFKGDLAAQKPYILEIEEGQAELDLASLDPDFAAGKVSKPDGDAKLSDTKLKKPAAGQTLAYTYQDGVSVPCSFEIASGNYWTEPLDIENWSVDEEPNQPTAEAKEGKVSFTYAREGGPFTEEIPTEPGSYVVRATVPAGDGYEALEDEKPFQVTSEPLADEDPDRLEAYYGDTLSNVALPTGFTWEDPDQTVGDVGTHQFTALFSIAGLDPVEMPVSVRVLPKPGDDLDISPVTNEYEANHIVIKDGDTTLTEGTDYAVSSSIDEDVVTVTIEFLGNYTGEVTRTFTFESDNAWVIELNATGWTYGSEPVLPVAEARYGETTFTYAPVTNPETPQQTIGEFTSEVPENAGTYMVRATVAETSYYSGLSAETMFVIAKGQPTYTLPQGLTAIYGTQLSAIALPAGFSFNEPAQTVGDVGERSFPGVFTPTDSVNYAVAPVQIAVTVTPKNGSNFTVDRITTETQLQNPVIRDGNTTLVRDRDYTIAITRSGNQYTLTVNFRGNYTGQLVRTYNITQNTSGTGGGTTLSNNSTSGGAGTAPLTNDSTNLNLDVLLLILSAGVAVAMVCMLLRDSRRVWTK